MNASFPGSVVDFGSDRVDGEYIHASDVNELRAEVLALESALLAGGWLADALSWMYVSGVSFSVPGDRTAVFSKGVRLRWVQGSTKYGVVAAASYGGGITTVTLVANNDYAVMNQAITSAAYSLYPQPAGWPGWFNFTPVWTGFSADPALAQARFHVQGRLCFLNVRTSANGSSNATSFSMTLPVPCSSSAEALVPAWNNGAMISNASVLLGSLATFQVGGSSNGWTASGGKRASLELAYEW